MVCRFLEKDEVVALESDVPGGDLTLPDDAAGFEADGGQGWLVFESVEDEDGAFVGFDYGGLADLRS